MPEPPPVMSAVFPSSQPIYDPSEELFGGDHPTPRRDRVRLAVDFADAGLGVGIDRRHLRGELDPVSAGSPEVREEVATGVVAARAEFESVALARQAVTEFLHVIEGVHLEREVMERPDDVVTVRQAHVVVESAVAQPRLDRKPGLADDLVRDGEIEVLLEELQVGVGVVGHEVDVVEVTWVTALRSPSGLTG